MFVTDKDKFIFFHVPKAAGTSIHVAFKNKYGQEDDPLPPIHHVRVKDYLKYNPDKQNYFKFSFVRNPFDRLVSGYCEFTQNRISNQSDKQYLLDNNLIDEKTVEESLCINQIFKYDDKEYSSYQEYCDNVVMTDGYLFIKKEESFEYFCENLVSSGWINDIHFMPQHKILCDAEDNLLVDFVGKYETLSDDVQKIVDRVGGSLDIGHWRGSNHDNYRKYYNDKTIKIVEEIFSEDLRMFNYSF